MPARFFGVALANAIAVLLQLTRIQSWSAAFDYGVPRDRLRDRLAACHAFEEDLKSYRLVFPEVAAEKPASRE